MRQIFGIPITNVIWALGVGWGIITFLWGLSSGFTIGARDFGWSILAVVFGFLMVLPITIVAYWQPKAAAVCLLVSFLILETAVVVTQGFRFGSLVGLLMGLPTAALVWGYTYMASLRGTSLGVNSSVGPRV